mmetsp:Transcript_10949/g.31748  ORF Transcript_10949/g.31748 Transcript_10949/m.31748 type:complete len:246 (-) Transcript_10949:2321-3058(-)
MVSRHVLHLHGQDTGAAVGYGHLNGRTGHVDSTLAHGQTRRQSRRQARPAQRQQPQGRLHTAAAAVDVQSGPVLAGSDGVDLDCHIDCGARCHCGRRRVRHGVGQARRHLEGLADVESLLGDGQERVVFREGRAALQQDLLLLGPRQVRVDRQHERHSTRHVRHGHRCAVGRVQRFIEEAGWHSRDDVSTGRREVDGLIAVGRPVGDVAVFVMRRDRHHVGNTEGRREVGHGVVVVTLVACGTDE